MEIPSTPWTDEPWTLARAREKAPLKARWRQAPGIVAHGFTHFRIEFRVLIGHMSESPRLKSVGERWCPIPELGQQALPTLMRKLVRHAQVHETLD